MIARHANTSTNKYICPYYLGAGGCKFGASCKNGGHEANGVFHSRKARSQSVCRNFEKGTCKYGASCHFLHQREGERFEQFFSPPNNLRLVTRDIRDAMDGEITSMVWRRDGDSIGANSRITGLPPSLMGRLAVLRRLDLQGMSKLRNLEGCPPTVEMLNLSGCSNLNSIQHLASCLHLKELNMSDCPAVSLTCLSSLTKLEILNYSHIHPSAVSLFAALNPLEGIPSSLVELKLSNWENMLRVVLDLSPLSACTRLQHLNLNESKFTSLTPLSNLNLLDVLECSEMDALRALDGCPAGLKTIFCRRRDRNAMMSLGPLSSCRELVTINFEFYCPRTYPPPTLPELDLSPLSSLLKLEALHIQGQPVKSVRPLLPLTRLEYLSIQGLDIQDLDRLKEARGGNFSLDLHRTAGPPQIDQGAFFGAFGLNPPFFGGQDLMLQMIMAQEALGLNDDDD